MRRWITVGWMFILSLQAVSQRTYRWVVPDGEWTVPGNWLPARTVPHTGDTLVFGDTALVSVFPTTDTVRLIRLEAGASVSWTGTVPVKLVTGDGTDGGLELEPGSELRLSGSGGVEIHIPGNAYAFIHGAVTCVSGPHRLLPSGTGKIYFEAGSVFNAGSGFTGNPFGTGALNSVVFREGATYTSIAGANPFGASAPNSVLIFEPGSVYRHQRATAPQLSGRTFGHFEIAAAASYNLSLPQDVVIQNDLVLAQGQFLFRPSGGTGNMIIYGNIIQQGTGTIQLGQEQWPGTVQLAGNQEHVFYGNNVSPILVHRLALKGGDLQLKKDISVTGNLLLENGIIHSSDTAVLSLETGAGITSVSSVYSNLDAPFSGTNASYIDGPLLFRGLEPGLSYVFPLGGLGFARPLMISGCSGNVQAHYFCAAPPSSEAIAPESGLAHLSSTEYWKITGMSSSAQIDLSFIQPVSGGIADVQHLRIAAFLNNQWETVPHVSVIGSPGSNGAVRGIAESGSLFTLASTHTASTLPFHTEKIEWRKTGNELHLHLKSNDNEELTSFQWYYSSSGIQWEPWGFPATRHATLTEKCASSGPPGITSNPHFKLICYFRNGDSAIFRTRINYTPEPALLLYPNPACEKIFIFFKESSSKSKIEIVSITGTVVQMVEMSREKEEIDISHLPKGMYFLHLRNKNTNRILPFLKQ